MLFLCCLVFFAAQACGSIVDKAAALVTVAISARSRKSIVGGSLASKFQNAVDGLNIPPTQHAILNTAIAFELKYLKLKTGLEHYLGVVPLGKKVSVVRRCFFKPLAKMQEAVLMALRKLATCSITVAENSFRAIFKAQLKCADEAISGSVESLARLRENISAMDDINERFILAYREKLTNYLVKSKREFSLSELHLSVKQLYLAAKTVELSMLGVIVHLRSKKGFRSFMEISDVKYEATVCHIYHHWISLFLPVYLAELGAGVVFKTGKLDREAKRVIDHVTFLFDESLSGFGLVLSDSDEAPHLTKSITRFINLGKNIDDISRFL